MVTVAYQKKGDRTLMTLVHSGFTSNAKAEAHEEAWNLILGNFAEIFSSGIAHRRKQDRNGAIRLNQTRLKFAT